MHPIAALNERQNGRKINRRWSIMVWTASWPHASSRHFHWGGNDNQTRVISNVISRLTARRRVTSSFHSVPGGRTGLNPEDPMDLKNTPVALPPLLSLCPSYVLDPIRCTHPGALIVRRGIRRTSAVFFGTAQGLSWDSRKLLLEYRLAEFQYTPAKLSKSSTTSQATPRAEIGFWWEFQPVLYRLSISGRIVQTRF